MKKGDVFDLIAEIQKPRWFGRLRKPLETTGLSGKRYRVEIHRHRGKKQIHVVALSPEVGHGLCLRGEKNYLTPRLDGLAPIFTKKGYELVPRENNSHDIVHRGETVGFIGGWWHGISFTTTPEHAANIAKILHGKGGAITSRLYSTERRAVH